MSVSLRAEMLEPRQLLAAYSITELVPPPVAAPFAGWDGIVVGNSEQVALRDSVSSRWYLFSGGQATALASVSPKLGWAQPVWMDDRGGMLGAMLSHRTSTEFVNGLPVEYHLPDAFYFDGSSVHDLGPGIAVASNASGEVVGVFSRVDLTAWPAIDGQNLRFAGNTVFVYANARRHNLKLPPHVKPSSVLSVGINNTGDILLASGGFASSGQTAKGVYLYPAGSRKWTQISSLAFNDAAISESGQIAGDVYNAADDSYHTYVFDSTNRQVTDIGPGQVAGISSSGEVVTAAAVYQNGGLVDLSTLAPFTDLGFGGFAAKGVNDAGQIFGISSRGTGIDTTWRGMLLTPTSSG